MSCFEFRDVALRFQPENRTLNGYFFALSGEIAASLEGLEGVVVTASGRRVPLVEYMVCEEIQLPSVRFPAMPEPGHWDLTLKLSAPGRKLPPVTLEFRLFGNRIEFSAVGAPVYWSGIIRNGGGADTALFAAADTAADEVLRCASGPASHAAANLLYNRRDDSALRCAGGTMALEFDWALGDYRCGFTVPDGGRVVFSREEQICGKIFHLPPPAPAAEAHQFPTPPVGWMSWYSLRFDTCESAVLENARRMNELFRNFADKICIWVDWEWCHADLSGSGTDGVDVFHPRRDAYPHGLKYVSDAVKALGEIPALWCGATVEGRVNRFLEAHPEALLADFQFWPGHLWLDLTHPAVAQEYIPQVFRQFLDWGYEVFKWDCWLNTLKVNDEYRDRCFNQTKSLGACIREMLAAARRVIGEGRYLLGCTIDERPSLDGAAFFDGIRIGGDVFSWQDFRRNGVDNTFHFYPLHNTRLYLDPDTLVLRREYSSDVQARTRVAFLALTGLQLTLGDQLRDLDDMRIDALKRAMPVAAVHPVELVSKDAPGKIVQTLTAVSRPFGSWYVAGVFNFDRRRRKIRLGFRKLGLPPGQYAAFDFWSQKLLAVSASGVELRLDAGESAAVRLTPVTDIPALIGTSRHLLQGAVELTELHWDGEAQVISGKTAVAGGDPVTLTFCLPDGWRAVTDTGIAASGNLVRLTLTGPDNAVTAWQVQFEKETRVCPRAGLSGAERA